MLKGYDKVEAVALILSRIYPEDYPALSEDKLPTLIEQCVDADFAYMYDADILRADGSDGDFYYNTKNAFFFIAEALLRQNQLPEEALQDVCQLVDDYMDFNRSYLEKNGLKYHVDERIAREKAGW